VPSVPTLPIPILPTPATSGDLPRLAAALAEAARRAQGSTIATQTVTFVDPFTAGLYPPQGAGGVDPFVNYPVVGGLVPAVGAKLGGAAKASTAWLAGLSDGLAEQGQENDLIWAELGKE